VPPGWWPVPPGWWLLGLALFLVLLRVAYAFLRPFLHAIKSRHERVLPVRFRAMAALDELEGRRGLDAREAAYRLNEILQAALPEKQVENEGNEGKTEGEEWQHFWRELEMRYQPVMAAGDADIERWLKLARGWVEQLPLGDATDANEGVRRL